MSTQPAPKTRWLGLQKDQARRILTQLLLLLSLSAALGFTFNNSNPIGIRFASDAAPETGPSIAVQPLPSNFVPAAPDSGIPPLARDSTELTARTASVPGRIVHISWLDTKKHLPTGKVLLVDARPKVNFDHGHIPGAVNLPYSADPKFSATPADYEAFQKQYDKDTPIVVYCTTRTCQLSQIVAEKLVNDYGFTNVRKMNEGYLEYTEAESGTNLVKTVAAAPAEPFVKDATAAGRVKHLDWVQVKPLLAERKVVLVDARPKVNYSHGHIPGAVNLPYSADPKFSATPADFEAFEKAYSKDKPIVVYCTTKTCQLSQLIAEKLVELGYQNVTKMNQGYLEFTEAEGATAGETDAHSFTETSNAIAVANPTIATNAPDSDERIVVAGPASTTPVTPALAAATRNPAPPITSRPPATNPSRTYWTEVKPLLDARKIVLVDVRQAPTFELGHIPGAVNLPYTSTETAYEAFTKHYPKDAHIVMYCTDVGCPLSMKMSEILANRYGYKHVQHMTEGYAEWQRMNVLQAKATTK